ncbi:MAG: tetratricopeptide repeat protein [SAR324 cluster bacterium]|nr:tetratricopeptide repeat protein [SAR324 cluster bacterium]
MYQDERGVPFTAANDEAAAHFNAALDSFFKYKIDLGDHVKAALGADPEMPMGNIMRGYMMMSMGTQGTVPAARKSLAAAQAAASRADQREQGHITALGLWSEGDRVGANQAFEELLRAQPHDLLALKLVNFNYFWQGDRANMLESVARVLPAWREGEPGYGYLLGMQAFGMEECGDYEAAERAGRRAVEMHAGDHWAVHAVAHVMEMQNRQSEGVAWLDGLKKNWAGCNNFVVHLWWHRALFHLEMDQNEQVLALYDEQIRKEESDFYLDLQNAISLLWRLQLRGLDVGERWAELGDKSAMRIDDPMLPFSDIHFVMALTACGRVEEARRLIDVRRDFAATSNSTYGPVYGEVGVPVYDALLAFEDGRYGEAVALLKGVWDILHHTGGSHAQRDVIALTMIEAALRGEQYETAREWLAERTRHKAGSAHSWRTYAKALEGCGDSAGAQAALDKARALPGAG